MASATETEFDIGTLIDHHPGINGGGPIVAGTRLSVRAVVAHHNGGDDVEAILKSFPTLTPVKVYAALAFYYANKALIDQEIADQTAIFEDMRTRFPNGMGREEGIELYKELFPDE